MSSGTRDAKIPRETSTANLENDTDKDERRVRILRVKRLDEARDRRLWRAEGRNAEDKLRIKHQSLILAQDERWRRA